MRELISSLDIGSSKIKLVVAEMLNDSLNVLCAIEEDSRGVKKGAICEPDETEYAIRKILKKGEELLGVKISKVLVTVNEDSVDFKIGEAEIDIKEDEEVNATDIQKVLQMSVGNNIHKGNDLVSVIPIMFKVDDQKTRMPKGLKGSSLKVKSVIVSAPRRDIYVLAKLLEKCGVEIVDIMIPSIGSYYAHKNESTDTLTGIVVDCGAETIKVGVFNKGIIINNLVLPIGGKNIDNDIGFIYKLDSAQSKKIKETFAFANKRNASPKEIEQVVNTLGEKVSLNQYEVSEVAMSRLQENLNMAKNEINYLTKKEISYIIITGGLTEFKGFSLGAESVFGTKASVGKLLVVGARDNKYATCIGMIKYFDEKLKLREHEYSMFTQDEIDIISGVSERKMISSDSILGKVFGIFFDN
ncbi:MAG TPA: cell division protein FtsA [Bacilli bacterium]|nr:cell division protein FtsA [Bacilli bacterium]